MFLTLIIWAHLHQYKRKCQDRNISWSEDLLFSILSWSIFADDAFVSIDTEIIYGVGKNTFN